MSTHKFRFSKSRFAIYENGVLSSFQADDIKVKRVWEIIELPVLKETP